MEQNREAFLPDYPQLCLKDACLKEGFTLIELSVVLVIIGLIAGGVLVGRDLISAAAVRAQTSQIEQYQTAVNTFKGKYDGLPGDLRYGEAVKFGFPSISGSAGNGDGNGLLQIFQSGSYVDNAPNIYGEQALFWIHLKQANLVAGGFLTYANGESPVSTITGNELAQYISRAKLGDNAFVSVYAGSDNASNYFDLAKQWYEQTDPDSTSYLYQQPSLTVQQAYTIDKKMDDGLPLSGKVLASPMQYLAYGAGFGSFYWTFSSASASPPASADDTTCYDTGGAGSSVAHYSITTNNGMGMNCALSFKFQ